MYTRKSTHTQTHTHTHAHTHTNTHMYICMYTHIYCIEYTHTHTLSLSHTHSSMISPTRYLWRCWLRIRECCQASQTSPGREHVLKQENAFCSKRNTLYSKRIHCTKISLRRIRGCCQTSQPSPDICVRCALVLKNVFWYYRMCSITIECVLLL